MRAVGVIILLTLLAGCGGSEDRGSAAAGEPSAGRWRPWVLNSPAEVRLSPPPKAGSAAAGRDRMRLRAALQRHSSQEVGDRRLSGYAAIQPWLELAMELVASRPKDPPAASRAYALVSVAMADATVAAWHWKYAYRRKPLEGDALVARTPDPSYPSEHAAIAGAATTALASLFPEYPRARLDERAERTAGALVTAGAAYRSDARAGLALGRAVGKRVVAYARTDGFARRWNGRRPRGRGYWAPPPGSLARPVQPLAGRWRTWVMRSGHQFRPGPPPAFGSAEFRADAREVMRVGDRLTPKQKRIATFWAGGEGTALPPGIWNQVVLAYVRDLRLSTPRAARAFALLNVAMADAGVAAWDAKYTYWSPRPENAIRDLGLDRNWKPYLATPFFPAYVSGHATYSAAVAEVLAYLFPEDAELFRAKAEEAARSRVYGGIHYRSDNEAGAWLGRRIGRLVVERARRDGSGR